MAGAENTHLSDILLNQYPFMKGAESMRKRKIIILAIGIICLISGIVMAVLHVTPTVIPITMIFTGTFLITFIPTWFIMRKYIMGDALIRDEMVKRVDALSGYYTYTASLYFICVCAIINYFSPLSASGLLWTQMFFIPLLFILIRHYLMKRGVTE